jgi:hypothetical protein
VVSLHGFQESQQGHNEGWIPDARCKTLINATVGNKILSFMDGNISYNQIFMAQEDIHKTAFRVPSAMGLFEYVVMTFGLKNARTTYQRAMNYIYHDLISKLVEIYINDVVVKSTSTGGTWGIYAMFLSEPGGSDSRWTRRSAHSMYQLVSS